MKKTLIFFLLGFVSSVMLGCASYKSSYPRSEITIVDGDRKSESYLLQIFGLTKKDSLQVFIENKPVDLSTMNFIDSSYIEGESYYYYNIAVWRKPFTKDYYVYSLRNDFSEYSIPKLFHKKKKDEDIELNCIYKNRNYHCTLNKSLKKCALISVWQDSLDIYTSNQIALLE